MAMDIIKYDDLDRMQQDAAAHFLHWATVYGMTGSKSDLLAAGQFYGTMCALYCLQPPAGLERVMDALQETLQEG